MDDNNQNQSEGQTGIDQETERRNRENETGQAQGQQPEASQQPQAEQSQPSETSEQSRSEGGSGFVGSSGDQSSDYLTKGENEDFAPEGQGASETSSGTSDIETGQSSDVDATLDDGADTSQ
jgi:hypothetical protein